jgi:hypothetical protein
MSTAFTARVTALNLLLEFKILSNSLSNMKISASSRQQYIDLQGKIHGLISKTYNFFYMISDMAGGKTCKIWGHSASTILKWLKDNYTTVKTRTNIPIPDGLPMGSLDNLNKQILAMADLLIDCNNQIDQKTTADKHQTTVEKIEEYILLFKFLRDKSVENILHGQTPRNILELLEQAENYELQHIQKGKPYYIKPELIQALRKKFEIHKKFPSTTFSGKHKKQEAIENAIREINETAIANIVDNLDTLYYPSEKETYAESEAPTEFEDEEYPRDVRDAGDEEYPRDVRDAGVEEYPRDVRVEEESGDAGDARVARVAGKEITTLSKYFTEKSILSLKHLLIINPCILTNSTFPKNSFARSSIRGNGNIREEYINLTTGLNKDTVDINKYIGELQSVYDANTHSGMPTYDGLPIYRKIDLSDFYERLMLIVSLIESKSRKTEKQDPAIAKLNKYYTNSENECTQVTKPITQIEEYSEEKILEKMAGPLARKEEITSEILSKIKEYKKKFKELKMSTSFELNTQLENSSKIFEDVTTSILEDDETLNDKLSEIKKDYLDQTALSISNMDESFTALLEEVNFKETIVQFKSLIDQIITIKNTISPVTTSSDIKAGITFIDTQLAEIHESIVICGDKEDEFMKDHEKYKTELVKITRLIDDATEIKYNEIIYKAYKDKLEELEKNTDELTPEKEDEIERLKLKVKESGQDIKERKVHIAFDKIYNMDDSYYNSETYSKERNLGLQSENITKSKRIKQKCDTFLGYKEIFPNKCRNVTDEIAKYTANQSIINEENNEYISTNCNDNNLLSFYNTWGAKHTDAVSEEEKEKYNQILLNQYKKCCENTTHTPGELGDNTCKLMKGYIQKNNITDDNPLNTSSKSIPTASFSVFKPSTWKNDNPLNTSSKSIPTASFSVFKPSTWKVPSFRRRQATGGRKTKKYKNINHMKRKKQMTKRKKQMTKRKKQMTKKRNKIKKREKKWSKKYKKSINCKNPRGFSQKQYCKYGKK